MCVCVCVWERERERERYWVWPSNLQKDIYFLLSQSQDYGTWMAGTLINSQWPIGRLLRIGRQFGWLHVVLYLSQAPNRATINRLVSLLWQVFYYFLWNCFPREKKKTFVSIKHFVKQNISTFFVKSQKIKIFKGKKKTITEDTA